MISDTRKKTSLEDLAEDPLPNANKLPIRILLVNTGYPRKRFVVKRLRQLGIEVVAVHKEKNWAAPYVQDWILVDTKNHDEVLKKVSAYLETNTVDGIITFWEDDVLLTAKLNEQLGYLGTPYSVAEIARNKYQFRQFCLQHQLPAPRFAQVSAVGDLAQATSDFTFPVVVKPAFGSSSAYVMKADNQQELRQVFQFVSENVSTSVESALFDGTAIVVEEYIDGDEVDVDIIVQNGKIKFASVADNLQTREPFFIESGYELPSSLPTETQRQIIEQAEVVLERMGVINACVHFETKLTKNGPVPLEVNMRMGGSEVWPSVKKVWDFDLIQAAVHVACGVYIPKVAQDRQPKAFISGMTLVPEKSGVLSSLVYPKDIEKQPGVEEFHFLREVGDTILAPPADFDFLGWVTVSGSNHNDAREALGALLKQVEYEIVPFSGASAVGKTERRSPVTTALLQPTMTRGRARIEKIRHLDRSQQRKLTIGIACNSYSGEAGAVEADLASVGEVIQKTLQDRGYKTVYIDFNSLSNAVDLLKGNKVDFVFNVCERINDSSLLEPHAAAVLDAFQVPYTGSNPFTLGLCIDKIRVKKLLTYHDIPTAKWDYAYDLDDEIRTDFEYPLIVKPGNTDNSIGITNDSVVTNAKQLKQQMEYVLTQLQRPVLVEEYLDGDEYDVSIMGSDFNDLRVLPLSRSIFDSMPADKWHIYSFDSKWEDESHSAHILVEKPPKKVSKKLLSLITEIALDTYTILDCHDYGRVEIKLDKHNNPHVLELNPNPSINKGDCVPAVAEMTGLNYGDFIEEVIALAIKRYKDKPPYYHLQPNLR